MKAKLEPAVPLAPASRTIIDSVLNFGAFVFTIDGRAASREQETAAVIGKQP